MKRALAFGVSAAALGLLTGSVARASVSLLNDSFADGNRTNTNLPTDSADYYGQATGGSLTASAGKLALVQPSSSQQLWTYFTSDNSVPDGNQPHNAVTSLNVGDILTASVTWTMPSITGGTTKDFRFGLFTDPTDARVQTDTNNNGGGATSPWSDATGYAVTLPIQASGSNPFQISKRIKTDTSLLGTTGDYAQQSQAGGAYTFTANNSYTVKLTLNYVSASEMDVTAQLINNTNTGADTNVTSTAKDLLTSFGGTAVGTGAGFLPGSQTIDTKFDQFYLRIGSAEAPELDFTNFNVSISPVPEPMSGAVLTSSLVLLGFKRFRR